MDILTFCMQTAYTDWKEEGTIMGSHLSLVIAKMAILMSPVMSIMFFKYVEGTFIFWLYQGNV